MAIYVISPAKILKIDTSRQASTESRFFREVILTYIPYANSTLKKKKKNTSAKRGKGKF